MTISNLILFSSLAWSMMFVAQMRGIHHFETEHFSSKHCMHFSSSDRIWKKLTISMLNYQDTIGFLNIACTSARPISSVKQLTLLFKGFLLIDWQHLNTFCRQDIHFSFIVLNWKLSETIKCFHYQEAIRFLGKICRHWLKFSVEIWLSWITWKLQ